MATTGTQIITARVRNLLNDTDAAPANQEWIDALLLAFLNDGQSMVVEARPDALNSDDGTIRVVSDLAAIGGSISIADKWRVALVHYVCARAFECPGQNRLNLDAARHHDKLFWNFVKTL